jgi:hypothetical protein
MYKIFNKGNYIIIEDISRGEILQGLSKDVFVNKNNLGKNIYNILNIKNHPKGLALTLEEILKEDSTNYTKVEWETFYTTYTGNFKSGGASPQSIKTVDGQSLEGTGNINSILGIPYRTIVNLGNVAGVVNIDWNLGVKHKLNLTGNITISQVNFADYEGQKVQELEITSSSPAHTITWSLITPSEFSAAINFATASTFNNVSIRLLRNNIFQSNNLVK